MCLPSETTFRDAAEYNHASFSLLLAWHTSLLGFAEARWHEHQVSLLIFLCETAGGKHTLREKGACKSARIGLSTTRHIRICDLHQQKSTRWKQEFLAVGESGDVHHLNHPLKQHFFHIHCPWELGAKRCCTADTLYYMVAYELLQYGQAG